MTPQFDLFLLVFALESEVGKLGGYENGEYGENKALNRHDILLQKLYFAIDYVVMLNKE